MDADEVIENQYIIVLNENSTVADRDALFSKVSGAFDDSLLLFNYKILDFIGFSAKLSDEALSVIRSHPNVKYVACDAMAHALQWETQRNCPNWGPPSTSGPAQWDGTMDYTFLTQGGSGVEVFIIDTGIMCNHQDMGVGRCFGGASFVGGNADDCNGHGTHVASSVAGSICGVAKRVKLTPVRVLGCNGSGAWSGVIAGIDWVTAQGAGKKSVGNMSLGGSINTAVNDAVDRSSAAGIIHVVAAGNSNNDACNYSPASAQTAITVGSTDRSFTSIDVRSSFSSFGRCVDIWAPGSDIYGAWIGGTGNTYRTISGTSMASPHVAGQAAQLLGANLPPSQTLARLQADAHNDIIDMRCTTVICTASPNLMLHNGMVGK
jgi:subtilisin family serine protease